MCGNFLLQSKCGVQQGDSLGPLLFCLAVHNIATKLRSLKVWYLDDDTLMGKSADVTDDPRTIVEEGGKVGMRLNTSKCEVYAFGGSAADQAGAVESVRRVLFGIAQTNDTALSLLGSRLLDAAVATERRKKTKQAGLMTGRLKILYAHQTLFRLTRCLSMPKLLYALRTSRAYLFPDELKKFDDIVTLKRFHRPDHATQQFPAKCAVVRRRRFRFAGTVARRRENKDERRSKSTSNKQ